MGVNPHDPSAGFVPIPRTRLDGTIETRNGHQRIIIRGPCGHSHEMTTREAKALASWLSYFASLEAEEITR